MDSLDGYTKKSLEQLKYLNWIFDLKDLDLFDLFVVPNSNTSLYIPKNQNISKKHSIIFSGCSETQGEYLTDNINEYSGEDIWGFKIAKYLNKSAVNLGIGGASVYEIVNNLIFNISKNNKPDYIFCLFPDLNRLSLPNDPNFLIDSKYLQTKKIVNRMSTPTGFFSKTGEMPKYSKAPHLKEDVIPPIVPVWLNLKSILFLEKFCDMLDITLRYTTWSDQTDILINFMNKKFFDLKDFTGPLYPNYVESQPGTRWSKNLCNGEHKAELDINMSHKYYDVGSDGLHMGTHRHAHIAQDIINSLTN